MIDYRTKTKGNASNWADLLDNFTYRYTQWYYTFSRRREHAIEFALWWRSRGPINFRTVEESRRFYAELYQHILTTHVES